MDVEKEPSMKGMLSNILFILKLLPIAACLLTSFDGEKNHWEHTWMWKPEDGPVSLVLTCVTRNGGGLTQVTKFEQIPQYVKIHIP